MFNFFILIFLAFFTYSLPIVITSIFFGFLNYFINPDHSFNFNFFKDYHISDSIFIQIIALFTMYMLKDSLKFFNMPGLLNMIVYLKNAQVLSIIGAFLAQLFSAFFNTLSDSHLLIDLINYSKEFNSLNISQVECSKFPLRLKISDLSVDIRQKILY